MKAFLNALSLLVIVAGLVLATSQPAHAYADPGSGLLLLQTLGSILTAAGVVFRRTIAGFFRRGKSEPPAAPDAHSTPR